MTKILNSAAYISIFVFSAIASFSQVKEPSLENFSNPFQKKPSQNTTKVLSPTQNGSFARTVQQSSKVEIINGSIFMNIDKGEKLNRVKFSKELNESLNLDKSHSFKEIKTTTDELGISHTGYQQHYNGIPIDNSIIQLHSKNELLISLNGKVAKFSQIDLQANISAEAANEIAKSYLKVTKLINEYPIETVIAQRPNANGIENTLTYKVRIDSYSPFAMCYVYIDAKTGEVFNKINLMAHADTPGTGQTLYSGNQSMTIDNFSGGFRLRESGRKIETYNATNATDLTTSGFTGATDFINSTATWSGVPRLSSLTISVASQSWWFTAFADELPELYIIVKEGTGQMIYKSGYLSNTNPPITFNNLNILLTNPPYTVELWDYDAVGGDDFGGSYPIISNNGTQNYSGNGNNGTYVINSLGNPALDVHWGMEKTYDFYLSVFNRNSFDGNGSIIRQYLNPPSLFISPGRYGPNNAGALNPPYNIMVYGMGDGIEFNPVVGLDVEGHEYTHMVVANNGNGGLVYQGESGALNESFADIFGTCVEFYSGVNPDWTIGEDVVVGKPFLRSMSNPNAADNPDTYNGLHWVNPTNLSYDNGGVHINSGVQNFWFYLLSQGGSGTNDLGKAYAVTGIGIADARKIAYRNLTTYLLPNATYADSYNGSLQAAQDLFGNPSAQYTAVRQAWYAVGLGNDPNNYCSGTTNLTASNGTITDGSGSANYGNNANCKWIIQPAGATRLSLNFASFATESNNDIVYVYDGPDDTYPVLATWWGNTLPPTINSSVGNGAMCIKFTTNGSVVAGGWTANYTSIGTTPSCSGGSILSSPSGSFSDGSNSSNYGNNQLCYWFIAPPCASGVTLSFSQFNTELNYDGVLIYDDLAGTNKIATLSGTSIPSAVTSTTGKMLIIFVSDYSTTLQGFTANYTSTGSVFCSGVTSLNTTDYGTITDGSNSSNYCNNMDCSWLIQPPQATSVTLTFNSFDLEQPSSDGKSVYDAVEVYNGTTTSAPLIGRFSGSNIPPSVSSTSGSMLVRFYSDLEENKSGWSATYTSTQNPTCTGVTTLTTLTGSVGDGSGVNQYANNSNCAWLIQPQNAATITLTFSSFNTELNADGVIVYNGANNSAPILGRFSGSSIPSSVSTTGGSMYIEFLSGQSIRGEGWAANYTSTITTGFEDPLSKENLNVFPNPTDGLFVINSTFQLPIKLQVFDMLGRQALKAHEINKGENTIDVRELGQGLYILKFKIAETYYVERLLIR